MRNSDGGGERERVAMNRKVGRKKKKSHPPWRLKAMNKRRLVAKGLLINGGVSDLRGFATFARFADLYQRPIISFSVKRFDVPYGMFYSRKKGSLNRVIVMLCISENYYLYQLLVFHRRSAWIPVWSTVHVIILYNYFISYLTVV